MTVRPVAGLVLTPGASAGRDHSGLVAIDHAVTPRGIAVERVEFPGQAEGRRRPDTPAVAIQTVRSLLAVWVTIPDRYTLPGADVARDSSCRRALQRPLSPRSLKAAPAP